MIGEILTGLFALATGCYLWAKQRHESGTSVDSVQPIGSITDRVSISKEATDLARKNMPPEL